MEGDFTYGGTAHFTTEEELRSLIKMFVRGVMVKLYFDNYLFKKEKKFEFDIDEDTYYFSFPPIALKPKEEQKKNYKGKFNIIESIQQYYDRNKEIFSIQIEKTIKIY